MDMRLKLQVRGFMKDWIGRTFYRQKTRRKQRLHKKSCFCISSTLTEILCSQVSGSMTFFLTDINSQLYNYLADPHGRVSVDSNRMYFTFLVKIIYKLKVSYL